MYRDRQVRMIFREFGEFRKVLRNCRASRVERGKENERILKLIEELTEPRTAAEGRESKTRSIVPEELEAELMEAVQKAIAVINDFSSQAEFEEELFEEIQAALHWLQDRIFDPARLERLPYPAIILLAKEYGQLMSEYRNFLLESYRAQVGLTKAKRRKSRVENSKIFS